MRPAGSATTLSALAETTKSIGIRRSAAVSPGGNTDSNDDPIIHQQRDTGAIGGTSICAAVAALQDCLVCARRAVLAVTGAALRVRFVFYIDSTLRTRVLWFMGHQRRCADKFKGAACIPDPRGTMGVPSYARLSRSDHDVAAPFFPFEEEQTSRPDMKIPAME